MIAILITTTISAIAAVMWALCAAGTDGDFEEDDEDEKVH
nr:MAG TPA: Cytochrome oxidase maturation protein cbb3-type [Caudoviricetes sp.]